MDSESSSDLRLVARAIHAVQAAGLNVGMVGSYGLLASWFALAVPRTKPGALVVATSYRAATLLQLQVLSQSDGVLVLDATQEPSHILPRAVAALRAGNTVALTTVALDGHPLEPSPDPALRAALLARAVLAELTPTGLVLLGGEGSSALIRLLGPERLSVVSEPWPATAIVRLHGGPHDGLHAVIQSGSQGAATRVLHAIGVLGSIADGRLATPNGGEK